MAHWEEEDPVVVPICDTVTNRLTGILRRKSIKVTSRPPLVVRALTFSGWLRLCPWRLLCSCGCSYREDGAVLETAQAASAPRK